MGSTFVNERYRGLDPHLWIVISDPIQCPEKVVIVNVTTWDNVEFPDDSCILDTGDHDDPADHEWLTHRSFVFYRKTRCPSLENLNQAIGAGALTTDDDVSDEVLERIQQGANVSEFTPNEALEILAEQGFI